ncbi:unnamed protein product [Agarophyton chilense]
MAAREAATSGMAALRATVYNVLMRRNSVYVTALLAGGYVSTHLYFGATDSLWASLNRGKSWPEVCAALPPRADDDDDDD